MAAFILNFLLATLQTFVALLPRLALAWIAAFAVLALGIAVLKSRTRTHASRVDDGVRAWAKGLRYRDRLDNTTERIGLSWFFRFWTNFASAPSLSFFSLAIPLFALYQAKGIPGEGISSDSFSIESFLRVPGIWLLPGLCYAGSMLLSFWLKRVFKRVRPPREEKAFGYKLKDASFPSGHSLTSFCFWMMNAAVALHLSAPLAIVLALGGATIVALTGLSRVYLGVHFPTDVLGGFGIGLVWCVCCWIALYPAFAPKG